MRARNYIAIGITAVGVGVAIYEIARHPEILCMLAPIEAIDFVHSKYNPNRMKTFQMFDRVLHYCFS